MNSLKRLYKHDLNST